MTTNDNIFDLCDVLDQVRGIALEGQKYAKDPYDIDRYKKLIDIVSTNYSQMFSVEKSVLEEIFKEAIGSTTPKVGADAAVLSSDGYLLVLKRSDDNSWCLPCGWVDIGESPASAAVREVKEETGLDVEKECYISVSQKGPSLASHVIHQVNLITLMHPIARDSEIVISHEHTDYKWISSVDAIDDWHLGHDIQAIKIFDYINQSSHQKEYLKIL